MPRNGEVYLKMYPEMRKWIRQCISCQNYGYLPNMPDEARGARNLKKYFRPFDVNDLGICDQCQKHIK